MTEVLDEHGTEEHRGHELHVRRVRNETGGLFAEFELRVDGELVTTASEIEEQGWEHPWVSALFRYGRAYVDGLEGGLDE